MKVMRDPLGDTLIISNSKDYPMDWPIICRLWSLFGGRRPQRYKFIIKAPLTEVEKHL